MDRRGNVEVAGYCHEEHLQLVLFTQMYLFMCVGQERETFAQAGLWLLLVAAISCISFIFYRQWVMGESLCWRHRGITLWKYTSSLCMYHTNIVWWTKNTRWPRPRTMKQVGMLCWQKERQYLTIKNSLSYHIHACLRITWHHKIHTT